VVNNIGVDMASKQLIINNEWVKIANAGDKILLWVTKGIIRVSFQSDIPTNDEDSFVLGRGQTHDNIEWASDNNCYIKSYLSHMTAKVVFDIVSNNSNGGLK
jgi:hypothetical protein